MLLNHVSKRDNFPILQKFLKRHSFANQTGGALWRIIWR